MCARCLAPRRTSPFSAMICSILSTVVYWVGLRAQMQACTSRTVVGPRLHSTVRISSSASVGLGSFSAIYEEVTTKWFVCQAEIGAQAAPVREERRDESRRCRQECPAGAPAPRDYCFFSPIFSPGRSRDRKSVAQG